MSETSDPPGVPDPSPEAGPTAQNALNFWNSGQQQDAINAVTPFADRDEPWALLMISWFNHQRGEVGVAEGLRYATRAVQLGMPWVAHYFVNNAAAFPAYANEISQLATQAAFWGSPFDPIGVGMQFLQNGNLDAGINIMNSRAFSPRSPEGWSRLTQAAQSSVGQIQVAQNLVQTKQKAVLEAISVVETDLRTRAQQLNLLLDAASNETAQSLYEKEAENNKKEADTTWTRGVFVLGASVVLAVLPLALHYLDRGPDYSRAELLGAHLAASITLAAFAGVLLARSRSRDRSREQARNLAIAMGTMIIYSQQIQDPIEQQSFLNTMGRLVLESHLGRASQAIHASTTPADESGLRALMNALRQPPPQAP